LFTIYYRNHLNLGDVEPSQHFRRHLVGIDTCD